MRIEVQTSYSYNVGVYKIKVNGTLNDTFKSTIMPVYYDINIYGNSPYFKSNIATLTIYADT